MKPDGRCWKLFGLILLPEKSAQFHSCFMKLRLGGSDRAPQHPCDLFMLVAFDVVQGEDRAIAGRQLCDRFVEGDTVDNRHRVRVFRPFHDLNGRLTVFGRLFHPHAALAEMHQDLVDGKTMQPCRESRLAAKASYFSKELYEDLLREVFGLRYVLSHPEA